MASPAKTFIVGGGCAFKRPFIEKFPHMRLSTHKCSLDAGDLLMHARYPARNPSTVREAGKNPARPTI